MSLTHPDHSFASGHNQLKPFLVAAVIVVVTVAITLAFAGLPH